MHHTCTPSKRSSLQELTAISELRVKMCSIMANSPSGYLHAPGKLYVGNLPDRYTSDDLELECSRYGVIIDCHVHGREHPQKPDSHYGYITFDKESAALVALKKMKGRVIARRNCRPVGPLKVALVTEGPSPSRSSLSTSPSSRSILSSPTSPISDPDMNCSTVQHDSKSQDNNEDNNEDNNNNNENNNTDTTSTTTTTCTTSTETKEQNNNELLKEAQKTAETLKRLEQHLNTRTSSKSPSPSKPITQSSSSSSSPSPSNRSFNISKMSIIEDGAYIGTNVTIAPFSHILATAIIGNNTTIGSHCTIAGKLGTNNKVGPYTFITKDVVVGNDNEFVAHVVVGCRAEDYVSRNNVPTGQVQIGHNNIFREFVTIHAPEGERGNDLDGTTIIGNNCYLMRGSHVGHDNVLENSVTLACNTILAGYVRIGQKANLGIGSNVHQFTTIGRDTIIGMGSTVLTDIPPYVMFTTRSGGKQKQHQDNPGRIEQLNVIGMMRSGIKDSDIDALEQWYQKHYTVSNMDCFLSCLNKDWFQKDMQEYHQTRAKQNRRRPMTKVADGTPMDMVHSVQ